MTMTGVRLQDQYLSPEGARSLVVKDMLAQVQSKPGMTILIDGVEGTGKTYMLRALTDAVPSADDLIVTTVRADEIEMGEPYSFIERLVASSHVPDWNFVPDEDTNPVTLSRECIQHLVGASDAPARLVVIDDAQWIDEESQRVLRFIIPRVTHRRITMVFGVRLPHAQDSFGEFLVRLTTENPLDLHHSVEPFTLQEIAAHALDRLGVGISSQTAQNLLDETEGLFFRLESVLGALNEAEVSRLHLAWNARPRTVASRNDPLLHHFSQLSTAAQGAVEIVCLAGHEISKDELRAVARLLDESLDIDEAIRANVLTEAGFGSSIMPRHALLARAVNSVVAPERTREIYRALASVTSGYRSLRHSLHGAEIWTPEIGKRVDEFVASSTQRGMITLDVEVLRAALDLAEDPSDRAHLLESLGLVHMRAKNAYLMLDLLPEIESLPYSVLREFLAIVLAAHKTGEQLPMARVQRLLMTPAEDLDDQLVVGFFAFMVVILTMRSPNVETVPPLIAHAKHLISQGAAEPSELSDQRLAWLVDRDGYLLVLDAYLMVQDQVGARLDLVREALPGLTERVLALPDSGMKVDAAVAVAGAKHAVGDVGGARELAQHGVDLLERVIEPWAASTARLVLADCLVLQGGYSEAIELMEETEQLSYTALDVETRSTWAALRVFMAAVTGQENAAMHIEQARRQKEMTWVGYGPDLPIIAECELGRVRGDHAAILEASTGGWAEQLTNTRHGYLTYRAHALISVERYVEAAALIEQLAQWQGAGWHEYWGSIDWLRARLAQARGDDSTAKWHYEAAIDRREFPLPWSLTLADYGEFLVAQNQLGDAANMLQKSAHALENLGAHGYLPKVFALLDTLQREELPSLDREQLLASLTSREQQIVDHLVKGRSNNQIAESLVVSVTTVRSHVSNVLRKLNLSSRGEVARHFRGEN